MKRWIATFGLVAAFAHANPAIDMPGYLEVAREAAQHRQRAGSPKRSSCA